jgi:hypothetical protein
LQNVEDPVKSGSRFYKPADEVAHLRAQQRSPFASDVIRILEFFATHRIPVWLHGGWAVEALVGEPLSHQDVDLFARLEDRERILTAVGERVIVETSNLLFCNFDFVEVDIALCCRYRKNRWLYEHERVFWILPDLNVHGQTARLGGVAVPIADPRILYAEQAHEVRKRSEAIPKMRERAELLEAKFGPQLAEQSKEWWPRPNTPWNRVLAKLKIL